MENSPKEKNSKEAKDKVPGSGKVKEKKSIEQAAKEFIRVGDEYYKITHRPDKNGNLHRLLAKRIKGTIIDDYSRVILSYIPKYEDFVIVPSHTDYKQVIHGHYNKYYKISHEPKPGPYGTIKNFLEHIFGSHYMDFILDYFQLLYSRPTQNLPVILLESFERETGKSTFGKFVEKIFQFNTVAVGNKDLQSDFNSVWLDKLLIVLDETSLDNKEVMQTIKRLSTEKGQVLSNSKGKDKVNLDFIGKFIFMSNEEGKALRIERGEKRFAVFKVPTFKDRGLENDPDMLQKLEAEIPAFLHYLKNRKLVHEEKTRMYFDLSVYATEQLKVYFRSGASYISRAIRELVKDTFDMFSEEGQFSFSTNQLIFELTKGNYLRSVDRQQVNRAIEDDLNLKLQKKGRYTYFSLYKAETDNSNSYYPTRNDQINTHYTFSKIDFLSVSESTNSTNVDLQKVQQELVL